MADIEKGLPNTRSKIEIPSEEELQEVAVQDEDVEELKGPKEIQDLLFNFWKKFGPTLDPDRLKLIGFNMNDADDRTKVIFNLVEYYGDEELINIITDRLEGIQGWEYEYVVTSIDFQVSMW